MGHGHNHAWFTEFSLRNISSAPLHPPSSTPPSHQVFFKPAA
jgi:hypothetical protein